MAVGLKRIVLIKAASKSQIAKTALSCTSEIGNLDCRSAADSSAGFCSFSDCPSAWPSLVDTNVGSIERFDVGMADQRMTLAVS